MGHSRGQATLEYVALIGALALALAAILALAAPAASGLPQAIAGAIVPEDRAAAPTPALVAAPSPGELGLVDDLMEVPLEDFLSYRSSPDRDRRLDYSTDECTAPVVGSSGRTFDFTEACLRHDFGYRNYGRLGLIDERRREVDALFLADMQAHCATRPPAEAISCLGWARDFH